MAVTLTITIDDSGSLSINGPIDNKVLTFGILEVAKEAVAERHRQNQRLVQPASIMPPTL